jgi:hypothetical protein
MDTLKEIEITQFLHFQNEVLKGIVFWVIQDIERERRWDHGMMTEEVKCDDYRKKEGIYKQNLYTPSTIALFSKTKPGADSKFSGVHSM